jgi:hypothetical protein
MVDANDAIHVAQFQLTGHPTTIVGRISRGRLESAYGSSSVVAQMASMGRICRGGVLALRVDHSYVDKPFIHRLHSGEAFGDGGLVIAMVWGTALAFLAGSGLVIYLTMRRRNPVGMQRVFW